jgi:uncharacterized phiE125 gp8 family phage protein
MSIEQITPPAQPAVSLALAKQTLRITHDGLDATIGLWIEAITEEAEHAVGRSFINQGWRLTLDRFGDAVRLSSPPTVRVDSIKYFDADNAQQTLDPDDYFVDTKSLPGYVVPAVGKAWPETFDKPNALTVEYTCGYGATDASVPKGAKQYILYRLAEQFDVPSQEFKTTARSVYADRLLDRIRVY